ncbi:major pollen allergen Bet v 1-A [Selaginella moellendorffii]|uniref:major pollen allergen Bet v 1-A n=1 Tax=Selaginella moellendorffii TaxID=88036 RepID=UPI000D1CD272|nr:major pollen allergen Bet v 1-A [Selaginella moellendorffii]XP_024522293.1 major pollen allergen Bet v 1-A [Selaginella moellendorffii]|eukprot:XP_024517162.1 major pollen allergen Bet v 1-A [Selaginella moellendorffii]
MVAGSVATELQIKVPLERVWKAIKDSNNMFPKALPDAFTSVQTVEGDAIPHEYAKEKLESLDESNHSVVLSTIEGGPIGSLFSSQTATISLKPVEDSGTKVTWSIAYDSLVEDPPLDRMKGNAEKIMRGVEAYLLSNKDYTE